MEPQWDQVEAAQLADGTAYKVWAGQAEDGSWSPAWQCQVCKAAEQVKSGPFEGKQAALEAAKDAFLSHQFRQHQSRKRWH